jgi:3-hydroxybutyrate dehydrogenase
MTEQDHPSDRPTALVTGGRGGIGLAICSRLADEGWHVVSVDYTPGAAPALGLSVTADLSTRQGNLNAVEATLSRFGRLDAVIPVAGFQHVNPVASFDSDIWDRMLAVMLTSPFLLAKASWDSLKASPRGGRFLPVASAHGLVASPFKSGYVSAKHGVVGLTKVLALEGAEFDITATAICPGYVRTPLVENQIAEQAASHGIPEERVLSEILLGAQAVKEMIEPEVIGDAVMMLLGPVGRTLTGSTLTMDFGWTAR